MTGYFTSGGVAEGEAISMLLKSIPLNFYCILAVFGALAVSLFNINIGPMKKPRSALRRLASWMVPVMAHSSSPAMIRSPMSSLAPRICSSPWAF